MLERICFILTLGVAVVLAGGVGLAPTLAQWGVDHTLLTLFADDTTVRRTSLAAALGLTVTAFVFFRRKTQAPRPLDASKSDAPNKVAGA